MQIRYSSGWQIALRIKCGKAEGCIARVARGLTSPEAACKLLPEVTGWGCAMTLKSIASLFATAELHLVSVMD
jgi:hypothetical protein